MAVATIPLIPKDGTLLINDGAGSPLGYTIVYEDGDLQVTGLMEGQLSVQRFDDRGVPYAVRSVQRENIEFSFSLHAISLLGDGTTAMISDVALKLGVWASATSLTGATSALGDAYLVKLTFTGERSNFGATADTTMVLKYCRLSLDVAEGVPGKWSVKGTAFPLSSDYFTLTG